MLIISADDWGGWRAATDAALECYRAGRITCAGAMVFMEDSERAAELARGTDLDIGLHLNFMEAFTAPYCPEPILRYQAQTCRFLTWNKYTRYFYNPFLRRAFRVVYEAQVKEFKRIYKRAPSHFDGHQHMHLCTNMLIHQMIPSGEKVRCTFSFWPGEKSGLNRFARQCVNSLLASRYQTPDSFFSLSQCLGNNRLSRVAELAKVHITELMTHPERPQEHDFLMSDEYLAITRGVKCSTYARFQRRASLHGRTCSVSTRNI